MTLHLVLTHHWYDETASGRKRVEYRAMKSIITHGLFKGARRDSIWLNMIWNKRDQIKHVCFSRGYTSTRQTFAVTKIDIGPCPIPTWTGQYFRIHFEDIQNNS